ncbi:MAG TPA: DUF364 domain-containing protein [Fibrobacteria bacterium]|nr:DUF364 domain-containing protein [Fibrobacteria bacterium]
MSASPWELYDRLIDGIPPDIVVHECMVGLHWTLIRSAGTGMAMTPGEGPSRHGLGTDLRGRKVREVAQAAKSWNFLEAAIGIAAMNSWYNAPSTLDRTWKGGVAGASESNLFEEWTGRLEGKNVAVIGHFPGLERFAAQCRLSILERKPQDGDFPDPACEYILGRQDIVIATGTTLMNKTLPRLLALSAGREFALTGPTTPLCPSILEHGATQLAGSVVLPESESTVWNHVAQGGDRSVFRNGTRMIRFSGKDLP